MNESLVKDFEIIIRRSTRYLKGVPVGPELIRSYAERLASKGITRQQLVAASEKIIDGLKRFPSFSEVYEFCKVSGHIRKPPTHTQESCSSCGGVGLVRKKVIEDELDYVFSCMCSTGNRYKNNFPEYSSWVEEKIINRYTKSL